MKAILKILVPSKTTKGDYHTVEVYKDGSVKCECINSMYKSDNCWHIKKVKKILKVANK